MLLVTRILLMSLLVITSELILAAPKIETWTTSQGTEVYYVHAPELPMVDINIVFDAGSSRDGQLFGLAAMTNALFDQGAGGYDVDAISSGFESLGAIYGAATTRDYASLQLRSLADKELLTKALENFKRLLAAPDFPTVAIERHRARSLVGLKAKQQSPGAIARDAFMAALYQDHPYAKPPDGTAATIKAITRAAIVAFYQQYYVARNALLVIVGSIDRKTAESTAETIVSVLKVGNKAATLAAVDRLKKPEKIIIDHPSQQTHILLGQLGVQYSDPDYFPLYVGNHILGGGGMVSRLFTEVREERGLSYTAYSYFSRMKFKGTFMAGLQTKNKQAEEGLLVLTDAINEFIEQGPTPAELSFSKKNITGGYPLKIDSNREIMSNVMLMAYYGLPLDYLDTFNANIEAVTVAQIKSAFKRRLDPNKWVTVMVGAPSE